MSNLKNDDTSNDIFLTNDHEWFRARSCGIIIENNCVLMVTNDSVDYYYSVGGAIHVNESSRDACIREVFEETGINYEIDRLVFIHENFFIMKSKKAHEIAFYYLMKAKGNQNLNANSYGMNGDKEKMIWIPISEYKKYKAYPSFFVDELLELSNEVKHIVTNE